VRVRFPDRVVDVNSAGAKAPAGPSPDSRKRVLEARNPAPVALRGLVRLQRLMNAGCDEVRTVAAPAVLKELAAELAVDELPQIGYATTFQLYVVPGFSRTSSVVSQGFVLR
jgi:hypothetical protein